MPLSIPVLNSSMNIYFPCCTTNYFIKGLGVGSPKILTAGIG